MQCPNCSSNQVFKSKEQKSVMGIIAIIVGILLIGMIIGIPILISGLVMLVGSAKTPDNEFACKTCKTIFIWRGIK